MADRSKRNAAKPIDPEAERLARAAAYRETVDRAIDVVMGFIQKRTANDPEAREAFNAFCIVKSEARVDRTAEHFLAQRMRELEARIDQRISGVEKRMDERLLRIETSGQFDRVRA